MAPCRESLVWIGDKFATITLPYLQSKDVDLLLFRRLPLNMIPSRILLARGVWGGFLQRAIQYSKLCVFNWELTHPARVGINDYGSLNFLECL